MFFLILEGKAVKEFDRLKDNFRRSIRKREHAGYTFWMRG